jgi:hypothetical protein
MRRSLISASIVILAASVAHAQLPMPRLNSIFPCGTQKGTTVECIVAGSDLDGATGLYFSHGGITAQPAGNGKFKVTVAKDVPVGKYDVRIIAPPGLSNFRAFVVGDWPEALEKEPNDDLKTAQRVTLPVVVNGRVDKQTDLDHYVFTAKKGQRVLINCWAWRIDSQLDATLRLYAPTARNSRTTATITARILLSTSPRRQTAITLSPCGISSTAEARITSIV